MSATLKTTLKQMLIVMGITSLLLVLFSFVGETAFAQLINPADNPSRVAGQTGGEGSFRNIILQIVNFFLGFLGLIAVIMVIYGGIQYVTAAGNQEQIDKAKKVIMYAIIGIIIVLISFALVNTVIQGAGLGQDT